MAFAHRRTSRSGSDLWSHTGAEVERARACGLREMPTSAQTAWNFLFSHALKTTAARPSDAWLNTARSHIGSIGEAAFRARILEWFALVEKPKDASFEDPRVTSGFKVNEDFLRGLVWACATLGHADIACATGDLAVVCFTKIPNFGAVS